jgi:hypothetical protein
MMPKIHALNGIQTHDLSTHVIKAYASDPAATETSVLIAYFLVL